MQTTLYFFCPLKLANGPAGRRILLKRWVEPDKNLLEFRSPFASARVYRTYLLTPGRGRNPRHFFAFGWARRTRKMLDPNPEFFKILLTFRPFLRLSGIPSDTSARTQSALLFCSDCPAQAWPGRALRKNRRPPKKTLPVLLTFRSGPRLSGIPSDSLERGRIHARFF
jgi:hypothetical protein